jgi:hypothetical protein
MLLGIILAVLLPGWIFIIPSPVLGQDARETVSVHPAEPSDNSFRLIPVLQIRAPQSGDTEQWMPWKLQNERERESISLVTAGQFSVQESALTETNTSEYEPGTQRWSSFLPIWGEEAKKRGYELPFPFGISGSFFFAQRDIKVNSVDVDIKDTTLHVDDYAFIKVKSKERNWSMRLDAWIFPFLNIYVLGGYTHEHTPINIDIYKEDIVKGLFFSSLNKISARRHNRNVETGEDALPEHIEVDFDLDLYGPTYGGGATLVGGYKKLFFVVDTNYTVSDLTGDLVSTIS